jgi:putative membrane protein
LTVTEGTIPLKKVQALILRTNPLMRAFGWYELEVQTVGMNVDEQGHRVIAPFAQYDDLLALAQRVRSFDLPDAFGSVSPITIRRRFFRYTIALTAVLLPAAVLWPLGWWHPGGAALPWWGFAAVPGLLGWAVLQYRNHDYAVRDDGLYIRRGVLSHYLWILPTEKFHAFHATATVFQRRLDLKTLFVDTAGAATFAYPEVIDLPAAEADAQMDRLYDRFRTLYRDRIEAATGAPDTRLAPDERPQLPVSRADA